jgi:hypothetical protein
MVASITRIQSSLNSLLLPLPYYPIIGLGDRLNGQEQASRNCVSIILRMGIGNVCLVRRINENSLYQ